jgi:hypothetical protein
LLGHFLIFLWPFSCSFTFQIDREDPVRQEDVAARAAAKKDIASRATNLYNP